MTIKTGCLSCNGDFDAVAAPCPPLSTAPSVESSTRLQRRETGFVGFLPDAASTTDESRSTDARREVG
ncbi:unnamed protein product [Soboliphyme baturini]|uniref:Uncharacterized protein n=1 Tax=Soboliphyme baturini TaxID=241478 RepID=A0A183IMX8_9BILA|nr:unnamed protein product [Soboliphyme baturini]